MLQTGQFCKAVTLRSNAFVEVTVFEHFRTQLTLVKSLHSSKGVAAISRCIYKKKNLNVQVIESDKQEHYRNREETIIQFSHLHRCQLQDKSFSSLKKSKVVVLVNELADTHILQYWDGEEAAVYLKQRRKMQSSWMIGGYLDRGCTLQVSLASEPELTSPASIHSTCQMYRSER